MSFRDIGESNLSFLALVCEQNVDHMAAVVGL